MKTLLTLFGLLITGIIFSQEYYPIVQENNEWNVLEVDLFNISHPNYINLTYWISEDTVIGNNSYSKIFWKVEENQNDWEYFGAIREGENSKVWLYYEYTNEDKLLYDFTHTVGDTITYLTIDMVVDSISYYEISGINRKHIHFTYIQMPEIKEVWIEGIGSNKGILFSGNGTTLDSYRRLLCMSEDEELIYINPDYNECNFTNIDLSEEDNSLILINPNPAKDKLNIENSENIKIASISLIDLNGKKIKEFEENNSELDISEISSGIYLLKVSYEKGKIIRKIIIK